MLALLATNPFRQQPPRYVRATLYEYRMAGITMHRRTGAWWTRERVGLYFPVCALKRPGAHRAGLLARHLDDSGSRALIYGAGQAGKVAATAKLKVVLGDIGEKGLTERVVNVL